MVSPIWRHRTRLALLAVSIPVAAHAQFDTAAVVGTVHDPSGATIPGAIVILHDVDKGVELKSKTTHSGDYSFPTTQVGRYYLVISAPGFSTLTTDPFELVVGERRRVDLPMRVAGGDTTIDVNSSAITLDTDTSDRGTVIQREEIEALPLNGREYTDLSLLAPGVNQSELQNGSSSERRGSFIVNGMRSSANNFLLDGLDNNSYQIGNQGFNNQAFTSSVDAVREFKIVTSNFPAQYGRAGGAVLNVTTRSGVNKLHASLWEYIRNTALDAYGPLYGTGEKPILIQNQFGGTVGGHIERGKSFWFLDYEGFRQIQKTLMTATLPTDDQRNGIFQAQTSATNTRIVALPIKNPLTGKSYSNGIVPLSDMTPFARAVVDALPRATFPGFTTNFGYLARSQNMRDGGSLRLDRNFGTSVQAFVRLSSQTGHAQTPGRIPGLAGQNLDGKPFTSTDRIASGVTWQMTSRSILDARFGVTRFVSGKYAWNFGQPSFHQQFNIPYPVDPRAGTVSVNTQSVSGMTIFGTQPTANLRQDPTVYNAKINYLLQKSSHTIAVGFESVANNMYSQSGRPIFGNDTYNVPAFTLGTPDAGQPTPTSQAARNAALNFAAFLFGARSEYEFGNFAPLNQRYRYYSGFVQDDWRARHNLTLNIGLRYEVAIPVYERDNKLSNFDPVTVSLISAKAGSLTDRTTRNINWKDFAPRFGFSYQAARRMVFRGAYGISYLAFNRNATGSPVFNGPGLIDTDINQGTLPTRGTGEGAGQFCPDNSESLSCYRSTQQGYPSSMVSAATFSPQVSQVYYSPKDLPDGYVQFYNFGTQYQVTKNTLFDIAYVGTHGVHLLTLIDYNQAPAQLAGQALTLAQRRPIPTFTDISASSPAGFLIYNSLQTKLQHKSRNFFILNSFTWSQARDLAGSDGEASHGDSPLYNRYNPMGDSGVSGYNTPLNNSTAIRYELPRLRTRNHALRVALNGWTLTTVTRVTSGFPLNLTYTLGTNDKLSNLGIVTRPNLAPGRSPKELLKSKSVWVRSSTGLFIDNVLDETLLSAADKSAPFGNLPRNSIRFQPRVTSDLGIQKMFNLGEGFRLQFRAEAFNWMNHVNWGGPSTSTSAAAFGQISSAYVSRQIQLALRLHY
jgi:hypothetical protein